MGRKILTHNPGVDEKSARLNGILRKAVPQDTPGLALLVMDGDKPVLLEGHGKGRIRDLKIKKRMPIGRSVFELGSLSKQFTALAILMLIDQTTRKGPNKGKYERLSFRSKLSRFFPNLPRANEITIQHLLEHSSGLPDYLSLKIGSKRKFEQWYDNALKSTGHWYAKMSRQRGYMTNKDVIDLVAKQKPRGPKPGEKFVYSDTGYVVLAEIVRSVTGKSLGQFLKEEVFDRLKMNSTFVFDEHYHEFKRHALCYRRNNVTYESISSNTVFNYVHGDGNIHSTISDLVQWLRAWNKIDGIQTRGIPRLVNKSTVNKLFGPRAIRDRRKYRYSAGFFVDRYKIKNVEAYALSHGGDWLGFHSYFMRATLYLQPIEQQSIVVLANYAVLSKYDGVDPFIIAKELADIYWHLPPKYNVLRRIRYPA